MLYLRAAAEEYGLRRLIERALSYPQVQGVVLDIDPLWLWLWRARERLLSPHATSRLERWWEWQRFYLRGLPAEFLDPFDLPDAYCETLSKQPDMAWKPDMWKEYAEFEGFDPNTPPIVVKICILPMTEIPPVASFDTRLRVQIDVRPVARLQGSAAAARPLEGGVSIGDEFGSAGTLGGIVEDEHGAPLGVTCGHVLDGQEVFHPAQRDSASSGAIGSVAYRSSLVAMSSVIDCNPYAPGLKRSIDVALIQLDDSTTCARSVAGVGPVTHVADASSIYPGLRTEVVGKTSGHRELKVGGLGATYRLLDDEGHSYCFSDLFELWWPRVLRTIVGRPISPGDSGAWACVEGPSGTAWAGAVVGADRFRGFAMFAEFVNDHLTQAGHILHWS